LGQSNDGNEYLLERHGYLPGMFQDLPAIKAAIMYTNRVQKNGSKVICWGNWGGEYYPIQTRKFLVLLF